MYKHLLVNLFYPDSLEKLLMHLGLMRHNAEDHCMIHLDGCEDLRRSLLGYPEIMLRLTRILCQAVASNLHYLTIVYFIMDFEQWF